MALVDDSEFADGGMLVDVQRDPYQGIGDNGRDKYGPLETVSDVLFEDVDARVVNRSGTETVVRATLTILSPMVVSSKDRWVLPDGRSMSTKLVDPGVVPGDGNGRISTVVHLG
jgi:hypothetical protein